MEIQQYEKADSVPVAETATGVIRTKYRTSLTSVEIGILWTMFVTDSAAACILKHFLEKVEDLQIRPLIELTLNRSIKHLEIISAIFNAEDIPIPVGFNDEDLNVNAPRLFSDSFFLIYLWNMSRAGLGGLGIVYPSLTRPDVKDIVGDIISETLDMGRKTTCILLSKGLNVRHPYVSIPKNAEFVRSNNFFGSIFGSKRKLNVIEAATLYHNTLLNSIGKAMFMGLSQVAQSKQVREHFLKGAEILAKHIDVLSSILFKDDLPTPTAWDSEVTESTIAPFSDKHMMYHVNFAAANKAGDYGFAISMSMRKDLVAVYTRLMAELLKFAGDGAKISVKYGWMEEPPKADDHETIAKGLH
jgi:hypothetical protein